MNFQDNHSKPLSEETGQSLECFESVKEPQSENYEDSNETSSPSLALAEARDILRQFVSEREWHEFHTPRNLLLALVGEVGEVAEIFQWKPEPSAGLTTFSPAEKTHVGEELADVFSYLIRLADVCGVNLELAFKDKMQKNRAKYPKEMVKGSSKKYSEYKSVYNSNKE